MNKFKVSIEDYKTALLCHNEALNYKLQETIAGFIDRYKKSGLFKKPSESAISDYSDKLNNREYVWNIMDDEWEVNRLNWNIQENYEKYCSLDLVKDKFFEADDATLEFIQKYSK